MKVRQKIFVKGSTAVHLLYVPSGLEFVLQSNPRFHFRQNMTDSLRCVQGFSGTGNFTFDRVTPVRKTRWKVWPGRIFAGPPLEHEVVQGVICC